MTFKLVQISDAHLSSRNSYFEGAWTAMAEELARRAPDLVVATGDVALDAPDFVEDMTHAGARHAALGVPLRAVPGNHDVGEPPLQDVRNQTVDDDTLAAFRRTFGADFWMEDREDWRLIGIDSQIVHSGHAEEKRQMEFLRDAVDTAGSRKLAVFTHKPFELEPGRTPPEGYWTMHRDALPDYRFLLDDERLRLIASGHLHEYRALRHGNVLHVWAPSIAFMVDEEISPSHGGERLLGFVEYGFGEDVSHECVRLAGIEDVWLAPLRAEIYPPVGAGLKFAAS